HGEYWHGLVISHAVTRSVRDCAAILDAVAGPMPGDPYTAPPPARPFAAEVGAAPGRRRVGLLTHVPSGASPLRADCVAGARETARLLESLGHHVDEAHPAALGEGEAVTTHFMTLITSWVAAALDAFAEHTKQAIGPDDVEPLTWAFAEMGRAVPAPRYIATVDALHAYSRRMASWWAGGFDLLLVPTLGQPTPAS